MVGGLALGAGGCGAVRPTWQQEAVFELHRRCETVGAVHLEDVRPDGSYRIIGNPGSVAQYQRCTGEVTGTPEWQERLREIQRGHGAGSAR